MRGYLSGYSDYEYREARKAGSRASKAAASYRDKYLALRKECRAMVANGEIESNPHFDKLIGRKA